MSEREHATPLLYPIRGELMTLDQYRERFHVSFLRAVHEINQIVNDAATEAYAPKRRQGELF